jgi:hypothetical protein
MTGPSATPGHEEWEALVGKALLRFGDIEYVSVRCLSLIPLDRISDAGGRLSFSNRADLLIELLEGREIRGPQLESILSGLKRAKGLARKRNLLAHNPLMLSLYMNEDKTEHVAEYAISSVRSNSDTMDLAALKEFAADVEALSSELWMAYLKLTDGQHVLFNHRPVEPPT